MDGFTALDINLNGDGAFEDLAGKVYQGGLLQAVAVLSDGTDKGKPSVAMKVLCDDGTWIVAQTTWNLLYTAARAIEARYGPAQ